MKHYPAAMYLRLSKDDNDAAASSEGVSMPYGRKAETPSGYTSMPYGRKAESNSIGNQRELIRAFIHEQQGSMAFLCQVGKKPVKSRGSTDFVLRKNGCENSENGWNGPVLNRKAQNQADLTLYCHEAMGHVVTRWKFERDRTADQKVSPALPALIPCMYYLSLLPGLSLLCILRFENIPP